MDDEHFNIHCEYWYVIKLHNEAGVFFMDDRQVVLDAAVAAGDVPFVVAMCANNAGETWVGAAGEASVGKVAGPDTVLRIFSMTKAVGATAMMMLVDRGLASMSDPVSKYLPEAAGLKVLDGWDGDQPILRDPEVGPTLGHLATHTSGMAYDTWDARMDRWTLATNPPRAELGVIAGLQVPLMFDPGTDWSYGIGIDWLGRVVEAIDGRRIDRFLAEELFGPLGLNDMACEVEPHMAERLSGVWKRGQDGELVETRFAPPSHPEFYGMGHALYATPQDYLTFLRMLLGRGALNGTRILSKEAVQTMLANQVGTLSLPRMVSCSARVSADIDLFPSTQQTHSYAAVRVEEDVPGKRSAGAQGWAGILNTHWWIDPGQDLAAVLMTQTLPFVEPRFMNLYDRFERAVYADLTQ